MIKSISAWAFDPSRSAADLFATAKELGFEAVEVAIADGPGLSYQVTFDSTPEECAAVVKAAEEAGVKLASMASGFGWQYRITSNDPVVRAEGIELTKKALRVASYLGIDAILLVPGGVGADFIPDFGVEDYETAYANALDSLKQIAPVAEEVGVSVGVENVWNKFLLSPLEFRSFLDEVNSPRVGCYFDVGNVVVSGYPEQWIRILGSRITRVHFKDFKRSVGNIDGFCDLLDGDTDYPAVVAALEAIGYNGPVTAEFFNVEDQIPGISKAMDTILSR
jgi:L-ribulose-5-phosphate 3-epimerase